MCFIGVFQRFRLCEPSSAGEWGFKKHIWVKRHVGASLSFPSLVLVSLQGKRLPAYLSADAEEGEVSDDDSADEIEDDFKLKSSNVRTVH